MSIMAVGLYLCLNEKLSRQNCKHLSAVLVDEFIKS